MTADCHKGGLLGSQLFQESDDRCALSQMKLGIVERLDLRLSLFERLLSFTGASLLRRARLSRELRD